MDTYPPNSHTAKKEPKVVEQVTSTEATRRKKPLSKQFKNVFIGGDAKTTVQYVLLNVLLPAAKDALVDAGSQGIERLIYGETSRGRKPSMLAQAAQLGHVQYNRMGQQTAPPRSISARARQMHDFDEIVLSSRGEATDVLDRMFDIISKFNVVTVSDLYSLTGLHGTHVDTKWGWENLRGADVRRVRSGGFLLDLPQPEYLE